MTRHARAARRAARSLRLPAAACALGALVAPAPAAAGTYEVHQCRSVDGALRAPILGDWTPAKGDFDDNCVATGGLMLRLHSYQLADDESAVTDLAVPDSSPNASIVSLRTDLETRASSGSNSLLDLYAGTRRLVGGVPMGTPIDGNTIYPASAGARSFQIVVRCNETAAYAFCGFENGRPFSLNALSLLMTESVAPTATFSGTLVGTSPKAGTHSLVVTGADTDSGVKSIELRIDGTKVGSTIDLSSSCAPVRWAVCPPSASHTFTIDTTRLSDGPHAVGAVVTDHAGNVRTASWGDVTIRNGVVGGKDGRDDFDGDGQDNATDPDDDNDGVADPQDPNPFDARVPGAGDGTSTTTVVIEQAVPQAAPGASPSHGAAAAGVVASGAPSNGANASNSAVVQLQGARTRTVGYGRRVAATGRLVDAQGRPITGAVLTVDQRLVVPRVGPLRGASWTPVVTAAPVVTGRDGSFRLVVPAGASRTLRFGYRARLSDADFTATHDVTLHVRGKATLKPSRRSLRNGQKVTFSGRLQGGAVPKTGVTVVLQAKTKRGWVTFKTVRARSTGAFSAGYRFTSTRGKQTYVFRAAVKADSGYPFLPSTSATTKVTVRG